MKIRLDSGTVLDVDHELRLASAADQWKLVAVLQALHAALSVRTKHGPPYPGVVDAINEVLDNHGDSEDIGDACYLHGRSSMRQAVRQAAGVVEEGS